MRKEAVEWMKDDASRCVGALTSQPDSVGLLLDFQMNILLIGDSSIHHIKGWKQLIRIVPILRRLITWSKKWPLSIQFDSINWDRGKIIKDSGQSLDHRNV